MPKETIRDAPQAEDADSDDGAPQTPRAFWSGTLSFGLVSVPVELYPAHRNARVSLRMLADDGTPLSRRYFCPIEDQVIENDSLIRGYALESGEYVVVSDEELQALEPKKSRDIDLRVFVPEGAIDPMYFDRAYFLAAGGESTKAYRLLTETMQRTHRAGIATFVMRDKEYLIAIFAEHGLMRAQTLRFADELRSAQDVGLDKPPKVDAETVHAYQRVIEDKLKKALDPEELVDPSREALRRHAEDKQARGEDVIEAVEPSESWAEVVDLMEILKQRLRGEDAASAPVRAQSTAQDARPSTRKAARQRRKPTTQRARGPERSRGKRKQGDASLERMTRDQLYERARKSDVPGRANMSKPELLRALRKAQ